MSATVNNVREELVLSAVKELADGIQSLHKCIKSVVSKLADMNDDERELFAKKAYEVKIKKNWIDRMVICAKRGIWESEHLYAYDTLIKTNKLRNASHAALRIIADPDHEFPYVNDNGALVFIRSKDLTYEQAEQVWDCQSGVIDEKTQRKQLQRRLNGIKAQKAPLYIIEDAVQLNDDRGEVMELVLRLKDAPHSEVEVKPVLVRQLRRLLK